MVSVVVGRGHPAFTGATKLGIDAPGRRCHNEGHFLFVLLKDTQSELPKDSPLVRAHMRLSLVPRQQDRRAGWGVVVGVPASSGAG